MTFYKFCLLVIQLIYILSFAYATKERPQIEEYYDVDDSEDELISNEEESCFINYNQCCERVDYKYQTLENHIETVTPKETSHENFQVVYPIDLYEKCCEEYSARVFLKMVDRISKHNSNKNNRLLFAYEVNMTKENQELLFKYTSKQAKVDSEIKKIGHKYNVDKMPSDMRRQFKLILETKTSKEETVRIQKPKSQRSKSELLNQLKHQYSNARACLNQSKCLETGEIGMENFVRASQDYDDLAKAWKAWRDVTGKVLKNTFAEYVEVNNYGAKKNGYPDAGYYEYYSDMEDKNFPQTVMKLYLEILPLYKEIHAYVRYRLLQIYPGRFKADGPIPAHILGNVWAQQWSISDLVKPYKDAPSGTVTKKLQDMKNSNQMNVKKMFKMADEFYLSVGMPPMTKTFWQKSVMERPENRVMECHGSAFDMSDGEDYRIKMCTTFTHEDFKTIHHEMGHIQHYMAYSSLPSIYQNSACHGFHEAVGDTIALSVNTPEHLYKVGLLKTIPKTEDFDVNYLLQVALEKVVFPAFSLVVDSWRWAVYNGSIGPDDYNKYWWKLRSEIQGLMPPVARTKDDCDSLAKYHIAYDNSYIRYFVSYVVQFQFFEALCKESKNKARLHRCDFYQKKVGPKLISMLKLGNSKSWQDALETLTGSRSIETKAMMNYFKPLYDWLKKENKKNGVYVGWKIPNLDVE